MEQTKDETLFLVFQIDPLYIQLEASSVQLGLAEKQSPKAEAEFMGTFVQDAQNKVWILYLNDQEIARKTFTDGDLHPDAKKARMCVMRANVDLQRQRCSYNFVSEKETSGGEGR